MEQELLYGPGMDPKRRVFGEWEAAFGARGGVAAGECSGGGLAMNGGFGGRENSGNCGGGGGDFVAGPPEKMSFMELLGLAQSGAPIQAGATPAKNSGRIPDDNGISVPATPKEKEQVLRKKKVKTPQQQKVKRKKHRPKIFDESKPRRVPKSTPKRETGKRKYVRRSSTGQPPGSATRARMVVLETPKLNPQTPGPLVERRKRKCTPKASKHPLKSCKRGIHFDFDEDDTDVETVSICAEEQGNQDSDCSIANSSQYVDHKAAESDVECTVNSSVHKLENTTTNIYDTNIITAENNEKRMTVGNNSVIALPGSLDDRQTVDCAEQTMKPEQLSPNQNACKGVMKHNWGQRNTLQVYQRTFRENEILKNSRKLGPNCPSFAKKKRTKRRRANKYSLWFLEKYSEQKLIANTLLSLLPKSQIKAAMASVLPKSQIKAAMADPESFQCLFNLLPPIAKSKRKRSKRFPQGNSSHSPVTQPYMGKKSSNVGTLRALDSFPLVITKGKRSKTLMRRQGLPSSNSITDNGPNNFKLEAPEENFKLEAPEEIPTYPAHNFMEKDKRLLDTSIPTIIPTESSNAKVVIRFHPQHPRETASPQHPGTYKTTSDRTLCHPMAAAHPPPPRPGVSLSEYLWSSNSKLELRIHPPYPGSALQNYLLPTAGNTPGLRSKFKVEKRHPRHGTTMSKTNRMVSDTEFCLIQKLKRLQLSDEQGQLVVRDTNLHGAVIPYKDKFGAVVPYKDKFGAIIPYKDKFDTLKRRKMPKVELDPETIRRWNLLMENDASELPEDEDEKKKKDWEEQKEVFYQRLDVFIKCMQLLQGDRSFSPWKGSVVDSVVGVFLTQNVSDYLSSNAFMSLAAKFPVPSRSCDIRVDSPCSQESTTNTTGPNRQQSHETFISSREEKPGLLQDERVVEHPPVNHDFSCSYSETMRLLAEVELPSCQKSNSETIRLLDEVELPGCQIGNSEMMRLPGCQIGNSETMPLLEEETMRLLEDVELVELPSCQSADASFSLSGSNNPVHNGCKSSFDGNLGFECDCGIKSGCACACVRGMLEEVVKASANSNTLLNELGVVMEDNTLLNNTLLEENTSSRSREKKGKVTKMPKPDVDWEELRRTYYNSNRTPGRNLDSIDWDAVRCAPVGEIAKIIETRGMNNVLAAKIKAFLNRLVEDHGSIDLEWLKDVPPEKAKEFLLSIRGVGLKSTECVRLLTLGHHAFPVDTNIARIVVRLGWVPLEPLPGDLQIHLLEQYPQMDAIQKYLWPRLCTLDKNKLYLLHYQLITFGKVICTKKNPNCNACPMRAECKHFASAFASSRLRLRGAPEKRVVISQNRGMSNSHIRRPGLPHIERDIEDFPYRFNDKDHKNVMTLQDQVGISNSEPRIDIEDFTFGFKNKDDKCYTQNSEPTIEIVASQGVEPIGALVEDFPYQLDNKDDKSYTQTCEPIIEVPASPEPIVEVPASPEPESIVSLDNICDESKDDDEEIPHIKLIELNTENFKKNLLNFLNPEFEDEEVSNALVALTPKATTIPAPKIKSVERLRTRHRVYVVPDSHPLLIGFERREYDDPCPYLLAIWLKESESLSQKESNSQDLLICDGDSGNTIQETNEHTVCGTILIPCRTANKGSFPLNGTYFQVNEVFADHESSECPINVPRKWIWNLAQRNLYCGSTASAIARGMEMDEIQHCFWNGFVCVRAFDRQTRNPVHLSKRFHELPSVVGKKKTMNDD